MPLRWLAVAIGGVLLLGAVPAHARWSDHRVLGHFIQHAAGNARGEQAFIWTTGTADSVQVGDSTFGVSYPQARVRRIDGSLTRPQPLTRTRSVSGGAAAIGIDQRGTATAVWRESRPGNRVAIVASVRTPGGRFGVGAEIALTGPDSQVELAVAADGAAALLWSDGERVRAARRPAGGCEPGTPRGCFARPRTIFGGRCPPYTSGCLDDGGLHVAFGPRGRAYAIWTAISRYGDTYHTLIRLSVAAPGMPFAWSTPVSGFNTPSLAGAITPTADGAVLAWVAGPTQRSSRIVLARVDRNGLARARPRAISPAPCAGAQLEINPRDELTVAWGCEPDPSLEVLTGGVAYGPLTGKLGPTLDLGPRDYADDQTLATDGDGNTILVYSRGPRMFLRVRPAGRAFGAPTRVPRVPGGRPVEYGGRLIEAGDRVTLLQTGEGPSSLLSDWTP